nr:MAG TPA: hypothetical protein [Caudoviricetes sp.]
MLLNIASKRCFFIVVCPSDVKQDKNGSPSVSTRRT